MTRRINGSASSSWFVAFNNCARLLTTNPMTELLKDIRNEPGELQKSLATKAKEYAETIFPGITHLQHAQPIVFGHVLLCYHDRLGRDAGRFQDSIKRTTISPLGACAKPGLNNRLPYTSARPIFESMKMPFDPSCTTQ